MSKKLIFFLFILFNLFFISYAVENPKVSAPSAIAIDSVTGRILFEKNGFSKRAIASTTKVMTLIIAVENASLEDIVTISKNASQTGGSSAHLKEGQKIKLNELLYGLMLNSGNDAAVAIAEHVSGNVSEFAKLMNAKAVEIGAFSTNFVTPHGLDTLNHYSTAYDMAIISQYAIKLPIVANIVSVKEKKMVFIDGKTVHLKNTNALLSSYEGSTGIKTGYTGMAGRCLIGSAKKNDLEIISVVLGEQSSQVRLSDTSRILDYCFSNYVITDLCSLYKINFTISIKKGIHKEIIPQYESSFLIPLSNSEKEIIKIRKNTASFLSAPVTENQNVGEIEFILNDSVLATIPLISGKNIKKLSVANYFSFIFNNFLSLTAFN